MPEGLATADGRVLDLDDSERAFAAAMAAPSGDEPEHPAPPKLAADPEAPYGRKVDGTPKKAPGGRPPKARVSAAPAAAAAPRPAGGAGKAEAVADFSQPLNEFLQGVWMAAAALPVPDGSLRVRVRAQAAVIRSNAGGLVQSVNMMAQHNATIRWGVEKLTTGSAGWVLPACMALAPFAVQSAQVWRMDPAQLTRLAEQTDREWDQVFNAMRAEFELEKELADAGSTHPA